MSDILAHGNAVQPTTFIVSNIDLYSSPIVLQPTSSACISDLIPPVFSGVVSLTNMSLGQIRATWLAATDATLPIRYEIYVQQGSASGLFNVGNILAVTPNLLYDIFTLPNGALLEAGETYFVGVRAIDGVSNRDGNTVSQSIVSVGVSGSVAEYEVEGVFSLNTSNQLTAAFWATFSEAVITDPLRLGTASYQIFDRNGATVPLMTETGIAPDANGLYKITPVASTLSEDLSHYVVKVTITVDNVPQVNYLPIMGKVPDYTCRAVWSINALNQLKGTIFVEVDGEQKATGLGTASYQVYDASGVAVAGLTQSGIVADANGYFHTTPVAAALLSDLTHYVVKITVTVDGQSRIGSTGFTLFGN